MGWIGGALGLKLLNALAAPMPPQGNAQGEHITPLTLCYGEGVFDALRGKSVLDFGCGAGGQALEVARRGAASVVGLDIQEHWVRFAAQRAQEAGLGDRCRFTTRFDGKVQVVLSKDAFEHFDNPGAILQAMAGMLEPGGVVLASFGPTWLHPLGGHAFSVFPWAHLLFSEQALLRWRAQYRSDGATRFGEVAGGLNQLTIARFEALVAASPLQLDWLDTVPVRGVKLLGRWPFREFGTSLVRCRLSLR